MKPLFIAEVKTKSPFGFKSHYSFSDLFNLANMYGDIISIHVEKQFGGSIRNVEFARSQTSKLILAKGYHKEDKDIIRSLKAGANLILVVGRKPPARFAPVCIYEPLTLDDLKEASNHQMCMWNERDLETGKRKLCGIKEAESVHHGWICQASFIKRLDEVYLYTDAFIVGEHLPNICEELSIQSTEIIV